MGDGVGLFVGAGVGSVVGTAVGLDVGAGVGLDVGANCICIMLVCICTPDVIYTQPGVGASVNPQHLN